MGSISDASYDNALAESFVVSLKTELDRRRSLPTRESARVAIFEYIETFYNPRRGTQRWGISVLDRVGVEVRMEEVVAA